VLVSLLELVELFRVDILQWRPAGTFPSLQARQTTAYEINHGPPSRAIHGITMAAISPERQSARMSKITNDGLTRSGTGCFIAVPIWQQ